MKPITCSAAEAVESIHSGFRLFIHSVAAVPNALVEALTARAPELRDVQLYQLHTEGTAPYAKPEYANSFYVNAFFVGSNIRTAVAEGRASYIPVFLSEIPLLFRRGILKLDAVLITVSPPDQHGFCSLGTSVDATRAAVQSARLVLAQVNKHMPRTHGDTQIHLSELDYVVYHDEPLHEAHVPQPNAVERKIGEFVSWLVEDGATLQMGIGSIPNAVLLQLGNHKDLGIHTEMFSDGLLPLVEKGVVTGRLKAKHPGKIVSTFLMGSQKLYDFVNDNPQVAMLDVAYVNSTRIISQNPKVTAINSAIEVDFTGQVCADSMGVIQYSGVGGQMDFIRGASLSDGGKPIIALPSATSGGISRIVPTLKEGAGVVTTRAHVHYVVTEYGIAYLYGKNLVERAKAMIGIAHPDHREMLERAMHSRYRC
jgi:acyl-CoA hydrolase